MPTVLPSVVGFSLGIRISDSSESKIRVREVCGNGVRTWAPPSGSRLANDHIYVRRGGSFTVLVQHEVDAVPSYAWPGSRVVLLTCFSQTSVQLNLCTHTCTFFIGISHSHTDSAPSVQHPRLKHQIFGSNQIYGGTNTMGDRDWSAMTSLLHRYTHLKGTYGPSLFLSRLDIVQQKYQSILSRDVRSLTLSSSSRMTPASNATPANSRKTTLFTGTSTCSSTLPYRYYHKVIDSVQLC